MYAYEISSTDKLQVATKFGLSSEEVIFCHNEAQRSRIGVTHMVAAQHISMASIKKENETQYPRPFIGKILQFGADHFEVIC